MKTPTYEEIIAKYPLLSLSEPHEQVIVCAFLAGRAERMKEEVEKDRENLEKLKRIWSEF